MKEGFRQAMAWLHTWAGLVFGWLLFAIFLTGTLSYFKEEINHWAHPEIPLRSLDNRASLAQAQAYLGEHGANASRWFITLPDAREPAMTVMWQEAGKTGRGSFKRETLDSQTGQPVASRQSLGGEFFYRFHFELQMGYPWGRWLASLAAMVMLVTLVSGIITHKKVFKEFFTFRPGKGQRSWLDGHNAIGILVLPFHLMITYSSLVIFMTMLMPAGVLASYGGNGQAFFNDLFPTLAQVQPAKAAAPLVPLTTLYDSAEQHWPGARISSISVQSPGDANARVTLSRHMGDRIAREIGTGLTFDGVSGALVSDSELEAAPLVIGAGFYGLHMGVFAGPWLRWMYFLCGIAGTAMIGTGLVMWLGKRQLKHARAGHMPFELRLVGLLNITSMAGLLWAVAVFFWANRLLPVDLAGRSGWEVKSFFIAWGLSALHAGLRTAGKAWVEQLSLAALAFAGLPLLNALTTGHGLLRSLPAGDWAMAGVDLTALAWGLLLAWTVTRLRRNTGQPQARSSTAPARRAVTEHEVG